MVSHVKETSFPYKRCICKISEDIGSLSAVNGVKPLGVCAISGPYFITGELSLQNNDFLLSFNGRFSNSNY